MIPVILKGETSKPIQLTLREGYVYSGCVLAVCFRGVMKTFTDLVAGGTVELLYTAEETSTFPLGTGEVGLSIQNSAGDICFMPWAKIKVTDSPAEVHDAQITIDPATLNVEDLTSKDTLASVKSRLNAVMAFLRGLSALAILALPIYALSDVAPLTAPLDDIPGDTPIMTNVVSYVDAKVAAVPAPDYSTNNAQLRETIVAVSPPADLTEATNYSDRALGSFASTGTVARANVYGTPTRWTDATGCVWEVVTDEWIDHATGNIFRNGTSIFPSEVTDGEMRGYLTYDSNAMGYLGLEGEGWYYNGENTSGSPSTVFHGGQDATSLDNGRFTFGFTNLVGRVALTNDIPAIPAETDPTVPAWAKAQNKPTYTASEVGATDGEAVTNIVRGMSLSGIWDDKLGVWWTPHMSGGAYYWTATTNVNLAAEGNQ